MPGSARHRRPPDHPAIPVQDPAGILDEQERWDQFQRCLADSALPLDVRAAGALLLLFGMPISRIRRLRAEHLRDQDDGTHLNVGRHPLLNRPGSRTSSAS
ncbi:hypothetical protein ABZ815_37890 [Nonomuraea sp. NPDC047529]|uniref:hypothetical protein n=1 Tax=Nonomuraea sp. NPDC047529 TaxID=3155623 RepID=UPI0034046211